MLALVLNPGEDLTAVVAAGVDLSVSAAWAADAAATPPASPAARPGCTSRSTRG